MHQAALCVLQMGLGKTAQSIAVLEYQRQNLGCRGPFLVVAPLTTLGHWYREIETWTGMVSIHALSVADFALLCQCLLASACSRSFQILEANMRGVTLQNSMKSPARIHGSVVLFTQCSVFGLM